MDTKIRLTSTESGTFKVTATVTSAGVSASATTSGYSTTQQNVVAAKESALAKAANALTWLTEE